MVLPPPFVGSSRKVVDTRDPFPAGSFLARLFQKKLIEVDLVHLDIVDDREY
jgi:hypothetical protein